MDNRVDVSENDTRSMTEEEEFLWHPGELGRGVEQLSHALSFLLHTNEERNRVYRSHNYILSLSLSLSLSFSLYICIYTTWRINDDVDQNEGRETR